MTKVYVLLYFEKILQATAWLTSYTFIINHGGLVVLFIFFYNINNLLLKLSFKTKKKKK